MKKEEWKNKVLNSLEGIQRAKPSKEVYLAIENEIYTIKRISTIQLRWAVAAASLILVMNLFVFNLEENSPSSSEASLDNSNEYELLSNFTLYEL